MQTELSDYHGKDTQRSSETSEDTDSMVIAYRHDAHKFRGRSHTAGTSTINGIPVNDDVPEGADADAALLSRPGGKPDQTVESHDTHYRLSMLTGTSKYDPDSFALRHYEDELHALLQVEDAQCESKTAAMHQAWVDSDLAAAFNESVFYPYTSVKYHTLLVAALLDHYRSGIGFSELSLVVDSAETVVPHRTIFVSDSFALRISADADDRPAARLGRRPWRSWHSVWSRLTEHPIDTNSRDGMTLDANLRRIGSWSTALQYIEDYFNDYSR